MTNGTAVARAKIHPEGPELSRVIYGTWRIADSPDASTFSPEKIHARIRHCLDLGITTFDLADIYGGGKHQAERLFGAGLALEPALRSRMELVTKCDIRLVCDACPENTVKHYDTSRDYILQCVNDSLAAIGTTFVDVLLLHRPDPLMNADEVRID
jgi:predicted oxidoreductase